MRITKKELLEKAEEANDIEIGVPRTASWVAGVCAAARVLGYEVVEEPELPERVGIEVGSSAWQIGRVGGPALGAQYPLNPQEEALLRELALRYNAKAAVLKVVKRIENAVAVWENQLPHAPGVAKDLREYARLFRSAYEAGDE